MCRSLPEQKDARGYTYGKLASNPKAGDCGDFCDQCRWSWESSCPFKWKSDTLMARCMPPDETPYDPENDEESDDGSSEEEESE